MNGELGYRMVLVAHCVGELISSVSEQSEASLLVGFPEKISFIIIMEYKK